MASSHSAAPPADPRPQAGRGRRERSLSFGRILARLLVWAGACWLVVGGLLAPVLPGGWLTVAGVAFLATSPLLVMVRGFGGEAYPSALVRLWVMRPFWYGLLFLPLLAGAGLLGMLAGLPFGAAGDTGRAALAATALLLASAGAAGWIGTRRLVVRRLDALHPDLPIGLEGVRIAQLSDLHVGPHTSRRHLRRVVRAVEEAAPDLVAFTGDQVDDYARDVERFAAELGGLRAPLGVFAVAGNHDVYAGWGAVREGLERMGATVLVNEAVPVERAGSTLWVAGTGDPAGQYWARGGGADAAPDPARALASVPAGGFTLALAHNPVLWPALAERGAALTLSGHTHHGQLSVPRLGWSLASPFLEHAMGSHRLGAALLYINPGTNFWGIPFRIGALPEVTVVTLRRGDAPEIVPA